MKKVVAFGIIVSAVLIAISGPQYDAHPPFRGEADFKVIA
jgi:hypothetical protein